MIVVGTGHAFCEHYVRPLTESLQGVVRVIGTVDPVLPENEEVHLTLNETGWHILSIQDIPEGARGGDVAVMVLTPDHFQVIEELVEMGFRRIFVEKPVVSRDSEVPKLRGLIDKTGAPIYSADFYIPKTFPLAVVMGKIGKSDPRYRWMRISNPDADLKEMLGDIEGVSVNVIEAGKFCLPDIASRPWLATDPEIGGMLHDLGPHALAPLYSAGLAMNLAVHHVGMAKLTPENHLWSIIATDQVEMYANVLLEDLDRHIPVQISFGKVPFEKGGIWSLVVRGSEGMFFAGLRTGQPAVLLANNGEVVTFALVKSTYEIVIREALMYWNGELSGFDGNLGAFFGPKKTEGAVRDNYDLFLSCFENV